MLKKRGNYWYGDSKLDIRDEVVRYSKLNTYLAHHFANATCRCGSHTFQLLLDDNEGAAVRRCAACSVEQPIGDSGEYLKDANLEECACLCGSEEFEITVGVSLYENSDDVRWIYIGCRCQKCRLTAVYGDWKSEFNSYQSLLARV